MGSSFNFLVDSMLGKLAKWLRILGYDTLYQRHWPAHLVSLYLSETDRVFLTRNTRLFERWKDKYRVLFISSDEIFLQMKEMITSLGLVIDLEAMFVRCLICNSLLTTVSREEVEDKVPEFIFINQSEFKFCPLCRKIFWPGSHPQRMLDKLKALENA